jgi:Predicted membrane protein (DUF2207) C-terminal domain/Predicted membrane protein (DUF2207) N-terminal domain
MPGSRTIRWLLLCAALVILVPRASAQAERRRDFHSDITVEDDASLLVTETITVVSTGAQIRHGLLRDFPTNYKDPYGNRYVVGFQALSATRDSANEPFRVESYSNGKRIYFGNANVMVPPGRHIYTFSYTTNRQLGFFADHDELYWNVTGVGWPFPIDHASATVHLPSAIPADRVRLSGFTGRAGSHASQLTTSTEDGASLFATTKPLGALEGLSIVVSWPKGFLTPPTFAQKLEYFFRDNRDALLLASGLLVLLLYYLIAWSAVGHDPAPGVIMALYEPPANLSPAEMRYLLRMGFDNKTFAAAVLDMAARGFLKISEQAGSYTLTLTGKDDRILTPDEKQIATILFGGRSQIWLHTENQPTIHSAVLALQKWLKAAEDKVYFVTNSRYLIPPVALSIVVVLAYLLLLGKPQVIGGVFVSFWLTVWTLGIAGLFRKVAEAWRSALHSEKGQIISFGGALFLTAFSIPFLFGEIMGFTFLVTFTSISLASFLLAAAALHILFIYLLKAPTIAGRLVLDRVQGFKLFLGKVDGDRLNRTAPPQQTPEVFEKYLPYALALDVEQDWAEQFSGILGAAATAPGGSPVYVPAFYSGSSWNGSSGTSFASSFSSSFTGAIASSSAAPGSSSGSGGGGGGSGGGGGGGGGGGW